MIRHSNLHASAHRRRAAVLVVLAAALPLAAAAIVAPPAAAAAPSNLGCGGPTAAQQALSEFVDGSQLPGGVLEVNAPGCAPTRVASGVADLQTGRPIQPAERVRVGSVTKIFTAIAVLQQVAQHRIELDAPIERYLPGLIRRNGYDGRTITVRQLLNHTSGLPDYADSFDFDHLATFRYRHFAPTQLVARALSLPHPTSTWSYATTNYVLAALIVEKVTHLDFATYLDRNIFAPLHLRDTYLAGDAPRIRGPHPRGYWLLAPPPHDRIDVTDFSMSLAWSGGAIVSTVHDLDVMMTALLAGRLMPPTELVQMMKTVPIDAPEPPLGWSGVRWGLGLMRVPLSCGGVWWGHAGDTPGYSTVVAATTDGRSVALATNEEPESQEAEDARLRTVDTALCNATPNPPPGPTSGSGLDRFRDQQVTWTSCIDDPNDPTGAELDSAGAKCARVTVPLDYRHPNGRVITLALSRIAATDRAHYAGTLIMNGGGPGAQGLDMPLAVQDTMGATGRRYDLIGMDPRFVARSTPLDCRWSTGSFLRSAGTSRSEFEQSVRFEHGLANACRKNAGDVLPFVTTRNTARDIDVVRAALGQRKTSFFGYSYGTYLGEVYSQMFPRHVDRMVLDSAIDPTTVQILSGTAAANEAALRGWAAWTAQRNATYHLGATRTDVLAAVSAIQRAADHAPLRVGGFRLDVHVVPVILYDGLDDDRDDARAALADTVTTLARAARREPAPPSDDLADTLAFFLTGNEAAAGSAQSSSQYGSVQAAIVCGDREAPRNPESYWRDVQAARSVSPLFGAVTQNVSPCLWWAAPRETPTVVHNHVPSLVVGATGDPRTIYASSVGAHRAMGGSRLVTLRGAAVHAVYANYQNTCVDSTVNAYLATGRLPAGDVTCAKAH